MTKLHPDLAMARFIPRFSWGPRSLRVMRRLSARPVEPEPGVTAEEVRVPVPAGEVRLRVFRPAGVDTAVPALLWIHGGGLILGNPEQDDAASIAIVRELGIVVAAVAYRLAPESPAPAAVEDAYAGYLGIVQNADRLGIDTRRLAIGGASAGGGIAAALAQLIHDRGGIRPLLQLLVYPMLDDRTVTRTDHDTSSARVWMPGSNRFGWRSYLGVEPGSADVPPYAVPARRDDLSGLPPAWIGVGSHDLFLDEDVAYAARLDAAGVPCELEVVPGAFHGFDAVFRRAGVSRAFRESHVGALRAALLAQGRPARSA